MASKTDRIEYSLLEIVQDSLDSKKTIQDCLTDLMRALNRISVNGDSLETLVKQASMVTSEQKTPDCDLDAIPEEVIITLLHRILEEKLSIPDAVLGRFLNQTSLLFCATNALIHYSLGYFDPTYTIRGTGVHTTINLSKSGPSSMAIHEVVSLSHVTQEIDDEPIFIGTLDRQPFITIELDLNLSITSGTPKIDILAINTHPHPKDPLAHKLFEAYYVSSSMQNHQTKHPIKSTSTPHKSGAHTMFESRRKSPHQHSYSDPKEIEMTEYRTSHSESSSTSMEDLIDSPSKEEMKPSKPR